MRKPTEKLILLDRRTALAYAVAVDGIAAGLAARAWLIPRLDSEALFLLFAPVVLFAASEGGAAPGWTAASLGVAGVLVMRSEAGWDIDPLALGLFVVLSIGLGVMGRRMRAKRARLTIDDV